MPMDLRALRQTGELDPTASPAEPELVSREHLFELVYTSPEGESYQEQLVSRILDGDERVMVARLAARRAGVTWDQLPTAHAARIWAIATIAVQLRDPPDWVSKWATEDDQLLFSIYDVLSSHDSFFFRGDGAEGGEAANESRVSVHSSLFAGSADK